MIIHKITFFFISHHQVAKRVLNFSDEVHRFSLHLKMDFLKVLESIKNHNENLLLQALLNSVVFRSPCYYLAVPVCHPSNA